MNRLVGRRISLVDPNPFPDGRGGTAYNPKIRLDDGSVLTFEVQETETGYGVMPYITTALRKPGVEREHINWSDLGPEIKVPSYRLVNFPNGSSIRLEGDVPACILSIGTPEDETPMMMDAVRELREARSALAGPGGAWVFPDGITGGAETAQDLNIALDLLEENLWERDPIGDLRCSECGAWKHDTNACHRADCKVATLLRKHGRKVDP